MCLPVWESSAVHLGAAPRHGTVCCAAHACSAGMRSWLHVRSSVLPPAELRLAPHGHGGLSRWPGPRALHWPWARRRSLAS